VCGIERPRPLEHARPAVVSCVIDLGEYMIRSVAIAIAIAIALALAAIPPALAQTPRPTPDMTPAQAQAQVDPAAIYNFNLDGGQGIPLTKDIIRSYLAAPIARPAPELTRAAHTRVRAAEAGRSAILAGDDLFTPLWEEQAFELQDGSIRPMTSVEKAAFAELDAAEATSRSLRAQTSLSLLPASSRGDYAEALCRLIDASVRFENRDDGYRKVDEDWTWFDWGDGHVVGSRPPTPQAEIALLRLELLKRNINEGIETRRNLPMIKQTSGLPF
jgi:hypothetical protein